MLVLILAESAMEQVPRPLWGHPAVARHAERLGKMPGQLLLDRSYHHAAMVGLKDAERRGRPDIVHLSLLEAMGSPLNREGMLRVYVHTVNDRVLRFDPKIRLPRNYDRFKGLMEQLYEMGRVPPQGPALAELEKKSLEVLLDEVKPEYVLALSRIGRPRSLEEVMLALSAWREPAVLVGGFPRGHFGEETLRVVDELASIDPESLDAWIVTSRVVYEYERAINLPEIRFKEYYEAKSE
ncbi:MAG: 16S rRNA methyltransferase [Candidatus Bathyarchaeia archaeon]